MTYTRAVMRDDDDDPAARGSSLRAALEAEADAVRAGLLPLTAPNRQTAITLVGAKVLRAFTRDVPEVATDPSDNSAFVTGQVKPWAPHWLCDALNIVRGELGHPYTAHRDAVARARNALLRVMLDTDLHAAVEATRRIAGDDAACLVLHNVVSDEAAALPDPDRT